MWSAGKRAEGLGYIHPKPSSHSGRIVADSDLCHHGREAGLIGDLLPRSRQAGRDRESEPSRPTIAVTMRVRKHSSRCSIESVTNSNFAHVSFVSDCLRTVQGDEI